MAVSSEVVASSQNLEQEDSLLFVESDEGLVYSTNTPGITEEVDNSLEGNIFSAENSDNQPLERKEVVQYTVKEGDTISTIASSFGVKAQTLLWANNLQERSIIRPGDIINVPPKDGVLYKVKKGDTLGEIAKIYKTDIDRIIEFNGDINLDNIGIEDEIFLPDGVMPPPPAPKVKPKNTSGLTSQSPTVPSQRPKGSGCNGFPYGYCTYYVAQKRCVTWRGDAKYWLSNAQAQGYSVCWGNSSCEPVPGAIMVTSENSRWGHVVYVESVDGNSVTISEMNRFGFGKTSRRVLNKNDWIIRGYIY